MCRIWGKEEAGKDRKAQEEEQANKKGKGKEDDKCSALEKGERRKRRERERRMKGVLHLKWEKGEREGKGQGG